MVTGPATLYAPGGQTEIDSGVGTVKATGSETLTGTVRGTNIVVFQGSIYSFTMVARIGSGGLSVSQFRC